MGLARILRPSGLLEWAEDEKIGMSMVSPSSMAKGTDRLQSCPWRADPPQVGDLYFRLRMTFFWIFLVILAPWSLCISFALITSSFKMN